MKKKALVMNMTILLSLALIAIVIIFILIAKSSSTYTKSTSCESTGGKCVKSTECQNKQSFISGCKKEEVCCIDENS